MISVRDLVRDSLEVPFGVQIFVVNSKQIVIHRSTFALLNVSFIILTIILKLKRIAIDCYCS